MNQLAALDASVADRRFLTAEWRHLVMVNYEIDPIVLLPYLPAGTQIDSWGDTTWVSIVAFQFRETRLLGFRIPLYRRFEEINLRFYVRRDGLDGPRRGVVFIREVVPRRAIAFLARRIYHEPYVVLPTRSAIRPPVARGPGRFEYGWKPPSGWCRLAASVQGQPVPTAPGSLEEFISEHYWGYNRRHDGTTLEYRVEHPRWNVWLATELAFAGDNTALYGPVLAPFLGATPRAVFVADGSPVVVYRSRALAG